MDKVLAALNAKLDGMIARRRELVAQRSRLVAERDSARLPQDIDKAAAELVVLNAKVDAAARIIADVDAKIADVTAQRDAAQLEANKAKAKELDADCVRIEGDIVRQLDGLEKLIGAYKSNRVQRAHTLGRVAWPDNKYGLFDSAIATHRSNAALERTFSER